MHHVWKAYHGEQDYYSENNDDALKQTWKSYYDTTDDESYQDGCVIKKKRTSMSMKSNAKKKAPKAPKAPKSKAPSKKTSDKKGTEECKPANAVKLYTFWKKSEWLKGLVSRASDMVTYVDNVAATEVRGGWCVNTLELHNGTVTLFKVDQPIGRQPWRGDLDEDGGTERLMYELDTRAVASGMFSHLLYGPPGGACRQRWQN